MFVIKVDKGQVTVIMDKNDYIDKMTVLFNDESIYKKIKKDCVKQISLKLNQLIKYWYDNDIIDIHTHR